VHLLGRKYHSSYQIMNQPKRNHDKEEVEGERKKKRKKTFK
jgi:hypothetical protein